MNLCQLCGSELPDDTEALEERRTGTRAVVIRKARACPGCGAKNTDERRAHLGLVRIPTEATR